jgi:hypothetical protein
MTDRVVRDLGVIAGRADLHKLVDRCGPHVRLLCVCTIERGDSTCGSKCRAANEVLRKGRLVRHGEEAGDAHLVRRKGA